MTSNGVRSSAVAERPAIGATASVPHDRPGPSSVRRALGLVDDLVLLLLAVLLLPIVIILAGAPIALLVRLVLAIAHRF